MKSINSPFFYGHTGHPFPNYCMLKTSIYIFIQHTAVNLLQHNVAIFMLTSYTHRWKVFPEKRRQSGMRGSTSRCLYTECSPQTVGHTVYLSHMLSHTGHLTLLKCHKNFQARDPYQQNVFNNKIRTFLFLLINHNLKYNMYFV